MKSGVIALCVILVFAGMIYIGITVINMDQKIETTKMYFCELEDMQFRNVQCGFGCWEDQCYGSQGVFELEKYGESYILIGYNREDFALSMVGEEK